MQYTTDLLKYLADTQQAAIELQRWEKANYGWIKRTFFGTNFKELNKQIDNVRQIVINAKTSNDLVKARCKLNVINAVYLA